MAKSTRETMRFQQLARQFRKVRARIYRSEGDRAGTQRDAMRALFKYAIERRRIRILPQSPRSIAFLTGSLGPGGSERQLVQTATGLSAHSGFSKEHVALYVRSFAARKNALFFLSEIERAGIAVHEIRDLPDFGGNIETSKIAPLARTVNSLPRTMRDGVIKLTDRLIVTGPDIVCLWQDGIVYDAGLATLLAGVPRVVLHLRSVPPSDRPDRNRPEYRALFRSMLTASNVSLCVNSRYAAGRYAAWLNIDIEKIAVIRNGVVPQQVLGDAASETMFRRFEAATRDAMLTIGTVMRMDHNKRPLLWVDAAGKFLKRRPKTRFILVGEGLLRNHAMSRAAALGIANRLLFVGLSTRVGFWLSKMDIFLLTSIYEGLPNALIEAQLAGVPVLTTAAGGAPEAIVPNATGLTMNVDVSADEIAAHLLMLGENEHTRRKMAEFGSSWALKTFAPEQMIRETVELFESLGDPLAK